MNKFNYFAPIFLFLSMLLVSTACKKEYQTISGFTQGSTYQIKFSDDAVITNEETDSILNLVDQTFSVYNKMSMVSLFNDNQTVELNQPFIDVYNLSLRINKSSGNYFDIAIRPLVTYWGFGPEKRTEFDSATIDSIRIFCDMNLFELKNNSLTKKDPRSQLDFNAVAQGYSVDMMVNLLESKGIENYLVEIGGEVRAKGLNPKGKAWQVGIDKPVEGSDESNRELETIISVTNFSLATSGSYRKFIEKDGVKYSHTINPLTGYPSHHNLLSVTITAPECGEADAVATAIMAMGMDNGKEFLKNNNQYQAFFIFSDSTGNYQTWMTAGFGKYISE